jgi:hypothetical protein
VICSVSILVDTTVLVVYQHHWRQAEIVSFMSFMQA